MHEKLNVEILSTLNPQHVDASNIDELRDADFVFCIDDGPAKALIIEKLEEFLLLRPGEYIPSAFYFQEIPESQASAWDCLQLVQRR